MRTRSPRGGRGRWRRLSSVSALLFASFSVAATCGTPPVVADGCVCQGDGVLLEIGTGQLDKCAPATAAWERQWHRDCREVCDAM